MPTNQTHFLKSQVDERPKLVGIDGGSIAPDRDLDFIAEFSLDRRYIVDLIGTKCQEVKLYQVGGPLGHRKNLLDALDKAYCTSDGGNDPSQDGIYPD